MTTEVNYLGLKLKNPILVGSCGLTNEVRKIAEIEKAGAAGVVLKSLFEEQIQLNNNDLMDKNLQDYPEAYDYIKSTTEDQEVERYLKLIENAKKEVDIPVIASINCCSPGKWTEFVKLVEQAGADAIELNVSLLPVELRRSSKEYEKIYFDITESVKKVSTLPVALKMSKYSSNLANLVRELSYTGNINSFVLFNKYYSPDIDINNFKVTHSDMFSLRNTEDPIRWLALFTANIEAQFASSSGVRHKNDVIKHLLAGADVVQVVSLLYLKGVDYISNLLTNLGAWMDSHNFDSIEDFKGKLNIENIDSPEAYERSQFMRYLRSYQ